MLHVSVSTQFIVDPMLCTFSITIEAIVSCLYSGLRLTYHIGIISQGLLLRDCDYCLAEDSTAISVFFPRGGSGLSPHFRALSLPLRYGRDRDELEAYTKVYR